MVTTLQNVRGYAHQNLGFSYTWSSLSLTGTGSAQVLLAAPGAGKRHALGCLVLTFDGTSANAVELYWGNFTVTPSLARGISHELSPIVIECFREPAMVELGLGGAEDYALLFVEATGGTPFMVTMAHALVEDT